MASVAQRFECSPRVPLANPQRGMSDKKAAAEKMRREVRAAIEEDKAQVRGGGREEGGGEKCCRALGPFAKPKSHLLPLNACALV